MLIHRTRLQVSRKLRGRYQEYMRLHIIAWTRVIGCIRREWADVRHGQLQYHHQGRLVIVGLMRHTQRSKMVDQRFPRRNPHPSVLHTPYVLSCLDYNTRYHISAFSAS